MKKIGYRTKEMLRQEQLPVLAQAQEPQQFDQVDALLAKQIAASTIVEEARKLGARYLMDAHFKRPCILDMLEKLAATYDLLIKQPN